ncbi:MAG: septation protein IspZ [Gammaproteobacteria bacterium]|nr:septation protein IspZ [Gammaproteobacteria bacterium]MCW8839799.1 septation protein IspZ [Gammaproteobacteria bacterium]MCW8958575.1 septation protein IspZ [Gammaproteobacteria bacterium]MCW8973929.1 septation protein IspZ [Gammaproteobacteria bacterium]MCW8993045.1 septation protein IspZ [Gammaproteobacteria bacterium]
MKFLFDLLPVILFFIAYKLYGIYPAIVVMMVATVIQVGLTWLKQRKIEKMHLITLALVVVLGGATLVLQDKAFFMWKPTAVNWLFALAFLGSHFIGNRKTLVERMMSHAIEAPSVVWIRLNLGWVLFFLLMGLANLYVANFFFQANDALITAAGMEVDLENCASEMSGQLLQLCEQAKSSEAHWVDFKLYGMMGLTFLFVIAQAFYLARHMPHETEADQ